MMQTVKVKLYPNATMRRVLAQLCDYRRYCWNQGLATWNAMYDSSQIMADKKLCPTAHKVRDELVANKQDWQYQLSARCLQLAITDLSKAWQNFFDQSLPDWGKPHFKSKKAPRQGFKTDRAKIVNGRLRLDRPQDTKIWHDIPFRGNRHLNGTLKVVSIYRENGTYWASLPFEVTDIMSKPKTGQVTGVDVNVGHLNYIDGIFNVCPQRLQRLYQRIKHYQRALARKRVANGHIKGTKSKNYAQTKAKLQRDYRKVANIQHDLTQKFTNYLVSRYDKIVIEDLDVKKMQMTHIASKGLQRSLFGYFRQVLTYKCDWYGKTLLLADRYYPSTQRCSNCGHVKKGADKLGLHGNAKHQTKHHEYVCYKCGVTLDRDENAVQNLSQLAL
ncbi:RNA-guided endonuclease InsQ/TnpB family protein [Loigolactobacillus bifermentans]|uniref:Transposase n=1 Tax=Loigolactobacillus bifermentans DSM 20003 TaxID=1423726 RepID=A0A0R1GFI6_9LACO|nr:RNA-guided endonuclease TnpB family protein [Loigolactobacillus bifermentans]KRK32665.1 transposase [Loigolactobacillus bifermentans DSM 20003]QGG60328.1 IS200/IS605 family element transposase accessory protein TnpB [Loigolactobacillus bifermentans]